MQSDMRLLRGLWRFNWWCGWAMLSLTPVALFRYGLWSAAMNCWTAIGMLYLAAEITKYLDKRARR